MVSKTSNAKPPTPTKTEGVITIRIPQDIIDEILDHLAKDPDFDAALPSQHPPSESRPPPEFEPGLQPIQAGAFRSLRICSLVSKSWVQSCRRHLFRAVDFTSWDVGLWVKTFPVPEESPAHHVRDLSIRIGGSRPVPEKFFEYTEWFSNVERLYLLGHGGVWPYQESSLWRLPQSATSLIIDADVVTLVQVRDIMAQLPNLDDLSLSGFLVPVDGDLMPGIGTTLRGRFGGQLLLRGGYIGRNVINMLLEIPSGLRFTEVIQCTLGCLPSAVRVVEACSETLVKLSHTLPAHYESETFEQSFDFSGCPNLQDVDFALAVGWKGRGLPWIPMALSTLRPATSPLLSAIQLHFACPIVDRGVKSLIKDTSNDLRRVATEVARIEREFGGVVKFTVSRDSLFEAALCALNIFQHHRR